MEDWRDVWAPAASRIAGRPVGTTGAGRVAQTIQTLRTCGGSLFSYSSAPLQHSHTTVLTCCWTTGRQQPWWCHIWQQFTLRPSPRVPKHQPATNRRSVPRQFILVAAHKSHACSHQFYYNANTMMSASWLVPVSLFPPSAPGMVATCSHLE